MKSPAYQSDLTQLLWGLKTDILRLHPGVRGIDRDFVTINHRLEHEGLSFLTKTLPALYWSIRKGLDSGCFTSPTGFSKPKGRAIPRLFSGLLCNVFDAESGQLIENDKTIESVRTLSILLPFFEKLLASQEQELALELKAVNSFFEVDDKCKDLDPSPFRYYVDQVSAYLLPHLEMSCDQIMGRHGPGAVAEGAKGNQKWLALAERIIETDSLSQFSYDEMFTLDSLESGRPQFLNSNAPLCYPPSNVAKLVTVAKNSTSRRTISVEPLLNQFVQQGLMGALRDSIEKCPILSQCIAITDQSKNQELARLGSLTGTLSTLDLKSASDLLSNEMVKRVFSKHTQFLEHVSSCRTDYVQFKQRIAQINKFAGMGNALTFPVQSVTFAVIAIAACLHSEGKVPSYRNVLHYARRIRCYGDDIVVETKYAHQVMSGLVLAGLQVNEKKSFFGLNFRESCGTEWFKGVNLTPIYLRYTPETISEETRALTSCTATANSLWSHCFYTTSQILVNQVEGYLGRSLPLVTEESGVLGLHCRNGAYHFSKWDTRLHRWLVKASVILTRNFAFEIDGLVALLKFFHLPDILGRPVGHLKSSPRRYATYVSQRWVAV